MHGIRAVRLTMGLRLFEIARFYARGSTMCDDIVNPLSRCCTDCSCCSVRLTTQ
jgi:hypothetical protein